MQGGQGVLVTGGGKPRPRPRPDWRSLRSGREVRPGIGWVVSLPKLTFWDGPNDVAPVFGVVGATADGWYGLRIARRVGRGGGLLGEGVELLFAVSVDGLLGEVADGE